jgi:hypothetical protein
MTAAVAVAAIATLISAASPAAGATPQRIEVTARVATVHHLAFPPVGRGGDAESALLVVHDRFGSTIGDLAIDCRWVTRNLRLCVAQMSMPLGAIALLGASRTRFIGQFSVVGGTGRYVGAAGTLLFREIGTSAYVLSIDYHRR